MLTVIIGAIVNFLLDPVFIFVLDMGVKGAAIATVVSQGISAAWVMAFLSGKRAEIGVEWNRLRLNLQCVRRITALGTASFIMHGTDSLVQIACNNMLLRHGGDMYIGIMTILSSVRQIIITPVSAVTDGASSVISFNYGAKLFRNVWDSIVCMTAVSLCYCAVMCVIILAFPEVFIRLFNGDEWMLEAGAHALRLYFAGFFMMAFQYSGQSAFKALNKAKHAVFFSLLRKVIIVIPLTLYLPELLGVDGVYYAEVASNYLGGGACFLTMLLTVRGIGQKTKHERRELHGTA